MKILIPFIKYVTALFGSLHENPQSYICVIVVAKQSHVRKLLIQAQQVEIQHVKGQSSIVMSSKAKANTTENHR